MQRKRKWDLQETAGRESDADKDKRGAETTAVAMTAPRKMDARDQTALAREAAMKISAHLAGDESKGRGRREIERQGSAEREEEEEEPVKKTKMASDADRDRGMGGGGTTVAGQVAEVRTFSAAETSLAHTIGLVLEEGDAEKEKEKVHHHCTGTGPDQVISLLLTILPFFRPHTCLQRLEETVALYKETIDINDCRHRYHLTKSWTIKQIEETTGALLLVRGKYYPDRKLATSEREPPLLLEVAAPSETALKEAVGKIREIMQTGPSSVAVPSHRERVELAPLTSASASKVFAPPELSSSGGGVRQKILGPQVRAWLGNSFSFSSPSPLCTL